MGRKWSRRDKIESRHEELSSVEQEQAETIGPSKSCSYGRTNESTKAVQFIRSWVEMGSAGLKSYQVGGCGMQIIRSDEMVLQTVACCLLVGHGQGVHIRRGLKAVT